MSVLPLTVEHRAVGPESEQSVRHGDVVKHSRLFVPEEEVGDPDPVNVVVIESDGLVQLCVGQAGVLPALTKVKRHGVFLETEQTRLIQRPTQLQQLSYSELRYYSGSCFFTILLATVGRVVTFVSCYSVCL